MNHTLTDYRVLIQRSLRHIFRERDQLLSLFMQPIMFMLLFRYVFGGAINTGGVSYINFLVAGILVQTASFGATTTAFSVTSDLQKGIVDRLKSLPIASSGLLVGHVFADLVRNIISAAVMLAVAFAIGFRPTASVSEWFLILGVLLLWTLALSWLSAILGIYAKSVEAVQWLTFMIIFPLTFASAAFVPTESMPKYLRIFAEHQPVTQVIEALRSLMVGTPMGNHALAAIIWSVGIIIVSVPTAIYLFKNKVSK